MAREIIERIWCDFCLDRDDEPERVEGTEVSQLQSNGRTKVMAACERHKKEFVDPFIAAMAKYGAYDDRMKSITPKGTPGKAEGGSPLATPRVSAATAGELSCLIPGCGMLSKNITAMTQHVRMRHEGVSWVNYRAFADGLIDADGLDKPLPDPLPCGFCERRFTGDKRGGARGGHLARQHPEENAEWVTS